MKKINIILLIIITIASQAQEVNNPKDATNFLEAYLSPLGEGLANGLNNGWYNTAKPHKLGGFDITLTINNVIIPNQKQSFNPNKINNFKSSVNSTPTILGKGEGAIIEYEDVEFKMPQQSTAISFVPIPALNIGLGLIKKTEINARYIPKYKYQAGFIGNGSINLWGAGIKHDLLQWLPFLGDAIPIDVSLQIAHTNLNTGFDIESNGVKQNVNLNINATTINLIASKKILMITGHASLGYNNSNTNFKGNTNFKLGDGGTSLLFDVPLDMNFKPNNEFKANIGARFNIAIVALQANYTFTKNYSIGTIGIGVSIR